MFLKRLEMQGFKSFAERLDIELTGQITAVVGPNGCGKSNIIDGIRWVFGEPNARILRGSRMEDVIFAGSDRRKPVGMAEVSVTLDNSSGILPVDYSEVRLTRRLYRSGESEFLINRQPCRLREVQNLLQECGIGYDSCTIIGQGRVDAVINSRPEERRRLIEEVAGLTRHLHRKQDSLRKLEDTEHSLVRLEDLHQELAGQVAPLAEQAQRAQVYREQQAELTSLEKGIWLQNWADLEEKRKQAHTAWEDLQTKAARQEQELASQIQGLADLRNGAEAAETAANQAAEKLQELRHRAERNALTLQLLQEKQETLEKQRAEFEERQQELTHRWKKLEQERLEKQAKSADFTIDDLGQEQELKDLENQKADGSLERAVKFEEIEGLRGELIEILKSGAERRNEINRLRLQEENRQRRLRQIDGQQQGFRRRQETLSERLQAVLQELSSLKPQLLDLQHQKALNLTETAELESELRQLREKAKEQQAKVLAAQSKLRVLKEMEQSYEGYSRAVREIMQGRSRESFGAGVRGVVAELLRIPARYEKAIEVALGGAAQYLVLDTEKNVQAAILFLKAKQYGRATFLPLDALRPPVLANRLSNNSSPGFLGRAAELVQFEPEYAPVAELLLGRVWVAESLEAAARLARERGFAQKIVTLDGEVINPGGAITGGSLPSRSSGIIGRSREVAELKATLALQQEALAAAEQQLMARESFAKEQQKLKAELEQRQHQLELAQSVNQKEAAQLQPEIERLREDLSEIDGEAQDLGERSRENQQELQQLEQLLEEYAQEEAALRQNLQQKQTALQEHDRRLQEIAETIARLRETKAGGIQRLQSLAEDLQRIENEAASIKQGLAKNGEQLITIEAVKIEQAAAIEKQRLQAGLTQTEIINQQDELKLLQSDYQIKSEKMRRFAALLEQNRGDLERLTGRMHKLELQKTKAESEAQGWQDRLAEVHQIDAAQTAQFLLGRTGACRLNGPSVRQKIQELQQALAGLGEVNLGAVEEYARVKERVEFLSAQIADLREAKRGLQQVITELDALMTDRFLTGLERVNQSFNQVFQDIFGGGKAGLFLIDATKPLESGIEIVAQPPGKKFKNLALLSGGEKALSAIALLFGMLQVRPGHLCVLDEIESALDEPNVDRLAQFLSRLAQKTQFIIVSHRKRTMEAAEALYGLTMEEKGVSKLISVQLTNTVAQAG